MRLPHLPLHPTLVLALPWRLCPIALNKFAAGVVVSDSSLVTRRIVSGSSASFSTCQFPWFWALSGVCVQSSLFLCVTLDSFSCGSTKLVGRTRRRAIFTGAGYAIRPLVGSHLLLGQSSQGSASEFLFGYSS